MVGLFLTEKECELGLNQLDVLVSTQINEEDGDEVANHIAKLASMQGYSARLMASCELLHQTDKKSAIYRCMYTLSERLNNSVGKSVAAYMTILSRLKEERRLAPFGS